MEFSREWTRRTFLQSVGAAVPTVKLMLGPATAGAAALGGWPNELDSIKFTPVDLSNHFTASPSDFGPRERAKGLSSESAQDGLIRTRAGKQTLRGIPFLLGPEGVQKRSWVVLSNRKNAWVTQSVEIPLNRKTGFICLAQFNDWDPNETPPPDEDVEEKAGQRLANVVMIFEDGSQELQPLRRRFEVNSPSTESGHLSFASLAHIADRPGRLTDSLSTAMGWGDLQQCVLDNSYSAPALWICAVANPHPDRIL